MQGAMKELGLTPTDVARKLDLNPTTVARILDGTTRSTSHLNALRSVLDKRRGRGLPTPAQTHELSGDVLFSVSLTRDEYACVLELLNRGLFGKTLQDVVHEQLRESLRARVLEGWCGRPGGAA